MTKSITEQFKKWAEKLRDISAYGLTFCRNPYDLENYKKIQDMSIEMTAILTGQTIESFEPIRKTIIGRPTPLIVVDAAIINEDSEVLLIQRTDNKEWAFPGGYLDIGETPAEAVIREVMEEIGIQIDPIHLVGIYDARRLRNGPLNQVSTILFLCHPVYTKKTDIMFNNEVEVLNKKWCSKSSLSHLDIDPYIMLGIEHAFQLLGTGFYTYFDK